MSISSQHDGFHRATMEAACLPRKQKNKIEENLFIAARWSNLAPKLMKCTASVIKINRIFTTQYDGLIVLRCFAEAHYENYKQSLPFIVLFIQKQQNILYYKERFKRALLGIVFSHYVIIQPDTRTQRLIGEGYNACL